MCKKSLDRRGKAHEIRFVLMNSLELPGRPRDNRVVVAMSGGVDSSVVAAMLTREGYDVVGLTLQLYDHGAAVHRAGACCAGQDIHDARRVADKLGIPHYVLDYESRFREEVIERFVDSYVSGETPVPCIDCNRKIKFRDLLSTARELGAAALATGHYVASRSLDDGRRILVRGADIDKDQSYFLYGTTSEQLALLRFPLGDMDKSATRAIAHELGLEIADKADSQDICFVPNGRYADLIQKLRPEAAEPGDVVHLDGRVLGRHAGVINFTVGQRKGLGVAAGEPLYVTRLDATRAEVIVGPRDALSIDHIYLRDINWLGDTPLDNLSSEGLEIAVRVRSTRPAQRAILRNEGGMVFVELRGGEFGVSPGQACVFYDSIEARARVLGGGTIIRSPLTSSASPVGSVAVTG
ncbi:MAG: tRNA 2-thiouridine(34) synthase MnmA [Hyphomicrobiales bacterium]